MSSGASIRTASTETKIKQAIRWVLREEFGMQMSTP